MATIKAANNIVGSEIEAWRDELWLPPKAKLGQAPPRPKNAVEEFIWMLRGCGSGGRTTSGDDTAHPSTQGMQGSMPPREEIQAYLAMSGGNVAEAVAEWKTDMEWEEEAQAPIINPMLSQQALPPPPPATTTAAEDRIVCENPMNGVGQGLDHGSSTTSTDESTAFAPPLFDSISL
eukprot:COSAG01_NODE_7379_length_3230_cov_2.198978_3_plen_177_part_00